MKLHQRFGVLGLVGLAVLGAACRPRVAPAPPPPAAAATSCTIPAPDATAARVLELANQARAAVGVAPLYWDGQLACLAQGWSAQMGAAGPFVHRDLAAVLRDPAFARFHTLGENILRATDGYTADQMHQAWMASPSHQANILSASFRYLGVGIVHTGGKVIATQDFGG